MTGVQPWKSSRHTPISICIDTQQVHMVQLKETLGEYKVTAEESMPIPSGEDRVEALKEALNACFTNGDFRGTEAVLCLTGHDLFTQHHRFSRDNRGTVEEKIREEFKRNIPFEMDDALVRYMTTGKSMEQSEVNDELIIMIANRKTIHDYLTLVKGLGLKITQIQSESLARIRALTAFPPDGLEKDGVAAFINISPHRSELQVIRDYTIVFSRSFPMGGGKFVDAVQNQLELDQKSAIRLIKAVNNDEPVNRTLKTAVRSALRPVMDEICTEIRSCFRYYSSISNRENVGLLILSGEDAGGIVDPDFITSQIEIPSQVWNTEFLFQSHSPISEDRSKESGFIAALGAALEAYDKTDTTINFLPRDVIEKRGKKKSLLLRSAFFVSIIMAMVLILFVMDRREKDLSTMHDIVQNRINLIHVKNDTLHELINEESDLVKTHQLFSSVKSKVRVSRILAELANASLEGITITNLKINKVLMDHKSLLPIRHSPKKGGCPGYLLRITGLAKSQAHLSDFVDNLSATEVFSKINDEGYEDLIMDNQLIKNFNLNLTLYEENKDEIY